MTVRAPIRPELLTWARERSGLDDAALVRRFPGLPAWESGVARPTLKQLEKFAASTHVPVGYLFLAEPPEEAVPIPDFRTVRDVAIRRPSPELLDTIYQCQQRQDWFRDYARLNGDEPATFVGTLTTNVAPASAAAQMSEVLGFSPSERGAAWSDAFRKLSAAADHAGVLVMVNGIVSTNTHRKLNPEEFRGFALADDLAPIAFVNAADTKAAQIFTLVHELAHLWLGASGLSDVDPARPTQDPIERWCNQVTAEFLMPEATLRGYAPDIDDLPRSLEQLASRFKVSTLAALRRLHDLSKIPDGLYHETYADELDRVMLLIETRSEASGGNFYNTQLVRVGRRFARAVVASTLEGNTLHRDAFEMLGSRKISTFNEMAVHVGLM